MYNTLCYDLHADGFIVLYAASSGIAALLLTSGRTSHSMLKIPIAIFDGSVCNFSKNSMQAALLHQVALIIWDEVPIKALKLSLNGYQVSRVLP